MTNLKNQVNSKMVKTIKVAVTTTLVLVITVNLVTQQVLAVSLENSTSKTSNSNIQKSYNDYKISTDEELAKYQNNLSDSIKIFLIKSIEERTIAIEEKLENRLNSLSVEEESKKKILNEILDLKDKLSKLKNEVEKDEINLEDAKARLYGELKVYKVQAPKIHFEIETVKLEKVYSNLGRILSKLETKAEINKSNLEKASIQIIAAQSNLSSAKEKINLLSDNLNQEELDNLKSDIRLLLSKSSEQFKIAKEQLSVILKS